MCCHAIHINQGDKTKKRTQQHIQLNTGQHWLYRVRTGRLEKYLDMKGFLEKSLKMKYALKSTGESL